jgi:hypothetical protein
LFLSKNIKIRIYIILNSPVVLYGCQTWSLIFKEEDGLRMFENWVLGKLFEPKKDEVTGDWKNFHNEKLRDLYSSNINEMIKSRMR